MSEEKENSEAVELYRKYDRIQELRQILSHTATKYLLLGGVATAALTFSFFVTGWFRVSLDILMFVLWKKPMFKLLELVEQAGREKRQQSDGLEFEQKLAQLLKDTFKNQKVKVYSRLDNDCLMGGRDRDVDIVAFFPNGQWFAISAKRRSTAKKVFIHADGRLRIIRTYDSAIVPSTHCPAEELIEQEKWLRQHRRNLLKTPDSSVVLPGIRLLVYAAPTIVGEQQPHQYASIGSQKFVKIERDKDFVYLLQEDQLCQFIQAVLKIECHV